MAFKAVIQVDERVVVKTAAFFLEEAVGKLVIDLFIKGLEVHYLGALEEGAFGRPEHLIHQVLSAAGKDKVSVMDELDM